ncbi:type II secretion system protein [Paenisporosarcina cavernae]|nr:type II secretion system protein [Paenisporosarcina cavernae]
MKNEKGVTLVELLASIVLVGLFGTIIWTLFFQGFSFNETEVSKQQIQQEATLLLNGIDAVHQKGKPYSITVTPTSVILSDTNSNEILFESTRQGITYELVSITKNDVVPKTESLSIDLLVKSERNTNLTAEVKTTFRKLK